MSSVCGLTLSPWTIWCTPEVINNILSPIRFTRSGIVGDARGSVLHVRKAVLAALDAPRLRPAPALLSILGVLLLAGG
jgi:hypothetical protein